MIGGEGLAGAQAGAGAGMAIPQAETGCEAAGVYLIDKPAGPPSFRMIQLVRRALGIKKVGHAGTLDPFASGLLVVCTGRPATRMIDRFMAGEKEYLATLRLGVETETLDPEGRVTAVHPLGALTRARVEECLAGFRGEQMQAPPAYSAVKYQGKPLYYYARKGVPVTKEPRRIVIAALECLALEAEQLQVRVVCSKGTYVRVLAADIGRVLGCGAHLCALRRLRSGPFSVTKALPGTALADPEQAREVMRRHGLTVAEALQEVAGFAQTLQPAGPA